MILNIEISDDIYEKMSSITKDRGITIDEFIRYVIGFNVQSIIQPTPLSTMPVTSKEQLALSKESLKVLKFLIKTMITDGALKCPHCTLALTTEAIEEGKCQNCGIEI